MSKIENEKAKSHPLRGLLPMMSSAHLEKLELESEGSPRFFLYARYCKRCRGRIVVPWRRAMGVCYKHGPSRVTEGFKRKALLGKYRDW